MSVHDAFSRFALVRVLMKKNPLVKTFIQPLFQLSCARKTDRSLHDLSIVGETEESLAGETWKNVGKQSRRTSHRATSAIQTWVERWDLTLECCVKIVNTARFPWQIHIARIADWVREYQATQLS
jgi:hypothetical protein